MSDELSPSESEELRAALAALMLELRATLEQSREGSATVAIDTAIGRLTRVDALQQQSMTQASARAAERRLSQVAAAIDRIEGGTYGACLVCGEPIALSRLRVRPEAASCIACQERAERGARGPRRGD